MVLVSKCCAGVKCRYNRKGFCRKIVTELGLTEDFIAVCPEVLGGLPTPREGCNVVNGNRVKGRRTGKDFTEAYMVGARKTLEICRANGIRKAYLLANSPSCGKGYGITARLLEAQGIEVIPI
ncbi:MAG: DUF523 domain-containing protein [Desulfobacteraceae bacterium]